MRIQQRLRVVQATSGQSWGLTQRSTSRLVNQFVLSSGLYGAAGYFGLATKQGQRQIATAYNHAQLHEVAGMPTLTSKIERQASNLANVAKRHRQPTPASYVLSTTPRQRIRLNKQSWRQMAESSLPDQPVTTMPEKLPPWSVIPNLVVHYSECSRSDPDRYRQIAALSAVEKASQACSCSIKFQIWCDGSVAEEGAGGGGYIILRQQQQTTAEEISSGSCPAGAFATSFTAEAAALTSALATVNPYLQETQACDMIVVTDSMALVTAIQSDPYRMGPDTIPAFSALLEASRHVASIQLVWISSHCGVTKNDEADRLAATGASLPQDVPLPLQAVKADIRRRTAYKPPLVSQPSANCVLTLKTPTTW